MQKINIRNWQISDAQALAAVANNRNVWNSIRNEFPSPYTVMDALAWIKHANEEKPVSNFAIEIGMQLMFPATNIQILLSKLEYWWPET